MTQSTNKPNHIQKLHVSMISATQRSCLSLCLTELKILLSAPVVIEFVNSLLS